MKKSQALPGFFLCGKSKSERLAGLAAKLLRQLLGAGFGLAHGLYEMLRQLLLLHMGDGRIGGAAFAGHALAQDFGACRSAASSEPPANATASL